MAAGMATGMTWFKIPAAIKVELMKGVVCFIRYATGKWIKVITGKAA